MDADFRPFWGVLAIEDDASSGVDDSLHPVWSWWKQPQRLADASVQVGRRCRVSQLFAIVGLILKQSPSLGLQPVIAFLVQERVVKHGTSRRSV